jgi:lipid-A-disaccharide synthase
LKPPTRLLISCGESSGDLYAGALVRELRALDPQIAISGMGGPLFAAAGAARIEDYRGVAVTGLTEAIRKIPKSYGALGRLVESARANRPDALVVIDFPDFNSSLASRIKALGIPVVYYVSPQIWAWRPRRIETIRRLADLVLVIFPFEEAIYREAGVPVEFVGHPLMDLERPSAPRAAFLQSHGLSASAPTIAILPGSRPNELSRILPDLMAAAGLIRTRLPGAQFVVARAPNLDDHHFESLSVGGEAPFKVIENETDAVLAASHVVLTASGTATVQTALHGTPMVIVYRMSSLSYRLVRRLVRVKNIGMVNLIAGETIVPELIQEAFTPAAVADEAISLLTDRERADRIRDGLARVREKLGGPGASRRAAEAILRVVHRRQA